MSRIKLSFVLLLVVSCLMLGNASAKHHGNSPDNTPGKFDYYLLTLSWAPEFCATHRGNSSSSECDPTHHFGFVVHGLWPENEDGSYPQHCASGQTVSQDTIRQMLPIMPDRDITKAFTQLQIPAEYRSPAQAVSDSPSQIEQKFADANHAPATAFRVSCSGPEFVALEVCLTKDLQYRKCGSGVRECRVAHVSFVPVP